MLTLARELEAIRPRQRRSEKKPIYTREEIEYQHDYGTMTEADYMRQLRRWSTGFSRTTVVYDESGEVERYALH